MLNVVTVKLENSISVNLLKA